MDTFKIQMAKRGVVTLPKALRERNQLHEGDMLALVDLGGVFVLTPKALSTDRIAERLALEWDARGENLESMLATLREVRGEYDAKG